MYLLNGGKKQKASVIQIVSDQQYKVCEVCLIYSSEEKGRQTMYIGVQNHCNNESCLVQWIC